MEIGVEKVPARRGESDHPACAQGKALSERPPRGVSREGPASAESSGPWGSAGLVFPVPFPHLPPCTPTLSPTCVWGELCSALRHVLGLLGIRTGHSGHAQPGDTCTAFPGCCPRAVWGTGWTAEKAEGWLSSALKGGARQPPGRNACEQPLGDLLQHFSLGNSTDHG